MSETNQPLTLPTLSLRSVPASDGIRWIHQGIATFGRYPLGFAGLFSAMMLMWMLVAFTPVLNMVGTFFLIPWFTLGFMVAAYRALRAETPTVSVFFEPIRSSRPQLMGMLRLSALFSVLTLVVLALATLFNAAELAPLLQDVSAGKANLEALAKQPAIQSHVLLSMGLISLVSLVFWHAPGLVFWGQQPLVRSVIFSVMALWRNKWAFLVYGVGWIALSSTAWFLLTALMNATGTANLLPLASLVLMTILNSILLLSVFFSFAGCFVPADWQPQSHPG